MDAKNDGISSIEDIGTSPDSINLLVGEIGSFLESSGESSKVSEKEEIECINANDSKDFHVGEIRSLLELCGESTKVSKKEEIKSTDANDSKDLHVGEIESVLQVSGESTKANEKEEIESIPANGSEDLSTATPREEVSALDLFMENLSLPYFTLPKPSYLEYTNQVAENLKTQSLCSKSLNNVIRNYELPPCVSIWPNIDKRTNEEICTAEGISSVHPDCEEEVLPNQCPDEEMARFKSSPDDDEIFIVDVQSPHVCKLQQFKEKCLRATTSKSTNKLNLKFSAEVGLKKSPGPELGNTQTENVSDGMKREVLRSGLLGAIKKKTADAFYKNKQLEQNNDNIEVVDLTDDDVCDMISEISEDSENSWRANKYDDGDGDGDGDGDDELTDPESDYSDRPIKSKKKKSQQLYETEGTLYDTEDFPNCSNREVTSYQPDGGFSKIGKPESDGSNHSDYLIITLSSDSDAIEDQNVGSNIIGFPFSTPAFGCRDTFEEDSVSQICSGVFPSTNNLPSTSSQSCFSSEIMVNKSFEDVSLREKSLDASCQYFEKASPSLLVKRKRSVRKNSESQSSCKESDVIDSSFHDIPKRRKISAESICKEIFNNSSENMCENVDLKLAVQSKESRVHQVEKNRAAQSFIEDEAELSGEEQSSDEDEIGLDAIEDEEHYEDVPDNEILRDQIGQMHLKHMQDDDDRALNMILNDFVDEGELHAEGGQRKKKFSWANKYPESDMHGIENSSDSDEGTENILDPLEHQNKLKWMKEAENSQIEPSESMSTKIVNLKMKIIGKCDVSVSDAKIEGSLKRKRGSLINSEGLKMKITKDETTGAARKKVFFVNDPENPVPSTSTERKEKADSSF